MQKNLRDILDVLQYRYNDKLVGNKKFFLIQDPDRLLFLVQVDNDNEEEMESYVDCIMSEVMSVDSDEDIYKYKDYSIRKILWDIYVVFVCLEGELFSQEEIFSLQRDTSVMKKYVVQGDAVLEQLVRIISPETEINTHLKSVDVMYDEYKICTCLCGMETYGRNLLAKGVARYHEVIEELQLINDDKFGEEQ